MILSIFYIAVGTLISFPGVTVGNLEELHVAQKIVSNVIDGSVVTNPEKYPFVALIFFTDKSFCGATILARNKLLSAAHCFHEEDGDLKEVANMKVYAGGGCLEPSPKDVETCGCQIAKVQRVVIHPYYVHSLKDNNGSDIGIVYLSTELRFDPSNKTVGPIQIWDADLPLPGHGTLVGWGGTLEETKGQLEEVNVPIYTDKDNCKELGTTTVEVKEFCAGGRLKGACHGDSGGPLLCQHDAQYFLCGIVLRGDPSCTASVPDIYTNASFYTDWVSHDDGVIPARSEFPIGILGIILIATLIMFVIIISISILVVYGRNCKSGPSVVQSTKEEEVRTPLNNLN